MLLRALNLARKLEDVVLPPKKLRYPQLVKIFTVQELRIMQLAQPRSRHRALGPCHSDLPGTFPILDYTKFHARLSTRDCPTTTPNRTGDASVHWLVIACSQSQISARSVFPRTLRTLITRSINCLLKM